jgi:zinc transport system substrate-binding protein
MSTRYTSLVALLLCCLVSVPADAARIRVAATIFPLADLVRQVGGDRVEVTTLLPAAVSEHTFEPTASLMRRVTEAQLLVKVGAGLDSWADRLFAGRSRVPALIAATEGVQLLPVSQQDLVMEQGKDHHHGPGDDPHVWLDPVIVRDIFIPRLVATLSRLSPADAPVFRANAHRYARELDRLDDEGRRTAATLPHREFIALHSAWSYFARRYGLKQIAAVEAFPGKEPSARYLAALISLARKRGVKTIFAEPQLSSKAARVIAAEIGGAVLVLDPVGGEGIAGRDSYLALMRYNLATIGAGMK